MREIVLTAGGAGQGSTFSPIMIVLFVLVVIAIVVSLVVRRRR